MGLWHYGVVDVELAWVVLGFFLHEHFRGMTALEALEEGS